MQFLESFFKNIFIILMLYAYSTETVPPVIDDTYIIPTPSGDLAEVPEDFKEIQSDIYSDIELYQTEVEKQVDKLRAMLFTLKDKVSQIQIESTNFIDEILKGELFTKSEGYDYSECINYGRRCGTDAECKQFKLDANTYKKSLTLFVNLFTIDFQTKFDEIKVKMEKLNLNTGTLKASALLDMLNPEKNVSTSLKKNIEHWKVGMFNDVKNEVMLIVIDLKSLKLSLLKLLDDNIKFQNSIHQELKERNLKFACCNKNFTAEIDGYSCVPRIENKTQFGIYWKNFDN